MLPLLRVVRPSPSEVSFSVFPPHSVAMGISFAGSLYFIPWDKFSLLGLVVLDACFSEVEALSLLRYLIPSKFGRTLSQVF